MLNVYLDIEIDWNRELTVVGFRSSATGLVQLIGRDITRARLLRELPREARLYTFNGHCFDLPCIHAQLGIDLRSRYEFIDLRWLYHKLGYRGGQKGVEAMLGIS